MILRAFLQVHLVILLVLGLAAQPEYVLQPHFSAESVIEEVNRHAALAPVDTVDTGHSHEDGETYERVAGHAHGHDPADHSHPIDFITVFAVDASRLSSRSRFFQSLDLVKPETDFGIEKPPKQQA